MQRLIGWPYLDLRSKWKTRGLENSALVRAMRKEIQQGSESVWSRLDNTRTCLNWIRSGLSLKLLLYLCQTRCELNQEQEDKHQYTASILCVQLCSRLYTLVKNTLTRGGFLREHMGTKCHSRRARIVRIIAYVTTDYGTDYFFFSGIPDCPLVVVVSMNSGFLVWKRHVVFLFRMLT